MSEYTMGTGESRFADIIWNHEPISSADLCRMAGEQLGWKKSTCYTVLRRLCDKGLFCNKIGTGRSEGSPKTQVILRERQRAEESPGCPEDSPKNRAGPPRSQALRIWQVLLCCFSLTC